MLCTFHFSKVQILLAVSLLSYIAYFSVGRLCTWAACMSVVSPASEDYWFDIGWQPFMLAKRYSSSSSLLWTQIPASVLLLLLLPLQCGATAMICIAAWKSKPITADWHMLLLPKCCFWGQHSWLLLEIAVAELSWWFAAAGGAQLCLSFSCQNQGSFPFSCHKPGYNPCPRSRWNGKLVFNTLNSNLLTVNCFIN